MPNPEREPTDKHPIAYFCAEYGFEHNLPLYAGGLGVLAGDTIKQAADDGFPVIGIGLLYHGVGMRQKITPDGLQIDANVRFDPYSSGLEHVYHDDDHPLFIKVHLTEVDVWLRVWKKTFSNKVVVYLLDTNTDQNQPSERSITQILYSGTEESQLKQQLLLGIGGVKVLRNLGIYPSWYHINEGRPAFLHWQLIRRYMDTHHIDYESARALAREKTVYTNHTLVGAGNQSYPTELLKKYGQYYAEKMGINIEHLLAPGVEDNPDSFSITRFALNCSSRANGVSALHSRLSEEQWPGYNWCNITNGVHHGTWQSPEIRDIVESHHGDLATVSPRDLWEAHQTNKNQLETYVKEKTGYGYDPHTLVIGWARRIAGYKRFEALFDDIGRLKNIVSNPDRPVHVLLAGKAHQGDVEGKARLQRIIEYLQNELSGHALFIPDYDIEVGQMLTRGCDLWLNTPILGKEACGTSGMKAVSNGVLSCSVADGWVPEIDWTDIGWTLDSDNVSASLYSLLENTVVPTFYERDGHGIPQQWVLRMQRSIELSKKYSAARMLQEYKTQLYR